MNSLLFSKTLLSLSSLLFYLFYLLFYFDDLWLFLSLLLLISIVFYNLALCLLQCLYNSLYLSYSLLSLLQTCYYLIVLFICTLLRLYQNHRKHLFKGFLCMTGYCVLSFTSKEHKEYVKKQIKIKRKPT